MSKIHVLEAGKGGNYSVVVHITVPPGNNTVNKAWKDVLLDARSPGTYVNGTPSTELSKLTVGTGPGQTTQAEMDDITNGDVVELETAILVESGGATPASLDEMVDQFITNETARIKKKFKYYGYTQG